MLFYFVSLVRLRPSRTRVPPIDFLCPVTIARKGGTWLSEPFHTHIDGSELQLKCQFWDFGGVICTVDIICLSDCNLCVTIVLGPIVKLTGDSMDYNVCLDVLMIAM